MDVAKILPRHWLDPVVMTDSDKFNFWVLLISWLFEIVSIVAIASAFARQIPRYRQRNPSKKLPRAFWLFLALATVAFLITAGLRFEHKRLKYLVATGQIDLRTALEDTPSPLGEQNDVDKAYNEKIEYQADKLLQHRYLQERSELLRSLSQAILDLGGGARLKEMAYRLARDSERIFWAVQWYAGWFGWTLYLQIECGRRQLARLVALSFACLGGMVSLAGEQALFFALLILAPAKRTGKVWIPKRWVAVIQTAWYILAFKAIGDRYPALFDLDKHPGWPLNDRTATLNSWKAFAFFTGLVAICQSVSMRRMFCYRIPVEAAKTSFTAAWFVLALGTKFMFVKYAILAISTTSKEQRHWSLLRWPTHPWIQRRNPMDHHNSCLMEQFGVFGDHHWINALAFDVLISVLTLTYWSVVGRLDARAMVRCALSPWADDVQERFKLFRYQTVPDALANGGLRGGSTRSSKHYLRPDKPYEGSIEEERAPIKKGSQGKAGPSPSRELEDPDYRPTTRGRSRRKSSSGAASQPPEEVSRPRSRSRSVRKPSRGLSPAASLARNRRSTRVTVSPSARPRDRSASAVRRSEGTRKRSGRLFGGDSREPGDGALLPAGPAFEDRAGLAEQAGLTMAIFAFGGLGMASAAVLRAEALEGGGEQALQ